MAPVLETNWTGLGLFITAIGTAAGLLLASVGQFVLQMRTARAASAAATISANTNERIMDPVTGQAATHALANSSMTRMFYAQGATLFTIAALVVYIVRTANAAPARGRGQYDYRGGEYGDPFRGRSF
jgi:hypothetical protein